jgi:hypothetical protein
LYAKALATARTQKQPLKAETLFAYARALAATGQPAAAIARMKEAVAQQPRNAEFHDDLGTLTDASGREIYSSGYLKPDGMLEPSAHSFTNRPVNLDGNFVDNHMVWTNHSMAYDNSIQSGRSTLVR